MLSRNKIKYIQSLSQKKYRDIHGRFVVETPKVVNEFLNSSYKIETIIADDQWIGQNRERVDAGVEVIVADVQKLNRISQLKNAHQVVGVVEIPAPTFPEDVSGKWILALDAIRVPGNMGTILRIADWFGVNDIFCSMDTVDVYNPKTVQASMGSLAHVHVHYLNLDTFLRQTDRTVWVTALQGESVYEIGSDSPGVLVIGNEGKGVSDPLMSAAGRTITIPRLGRAESLNVAVATGIILSHLTAGSDSHLHNSGT